MKYECLTCDKHCTISSPQRENPFHRGIFMLPTYCPYTGLKCRFVKVSE